ncbi:MAG: NGG1p interacting factor NIF3 [Alteromonadales bacterium]|nr:NGG1p interacting factor NIF3 [Alteromonadales bacterium]
MYQLVFYVPENYCEAVKSSLFAAGAGRVGNYDQCAWQVVGVGQFQPLKNSKPFIGGVGELEKVDEYRVEMVCEETYIKAVLIALMQAHPYQTPAYSVIEVKTQEDF